MTDEAQRREGPVFAVFDPTRGWVPATIIEDHETGRRWLRCIHCGEVFPLPGPGESPAGEPPPEAGGRGL